MKYIKYSILFVIILITTGCWNYRELNELTIVSAIGIDKDGDNYNVSVEAVNAKRISTSSAGSGGSSNEAPIAVYNSSAKTLKEALNNIVLEAPNDLYIGHISLVVVSDELAREGLANFIGFLSRDRESRKVFPFVIVKNAKAIDVLKILTPLDIIPADNIKNSLEAIASISSIISDRLYDEFLMCLYMDGREPTVSALKVVGNPNDGEKNDNVSKSIQDASAIIEGSAVFKGDKLVGYLDNRDSLGYTFIRNKVKNTGLTFPCDKSNYGNVMLGDVKVKLKPTFKNDKPFIDISIKANAALSEYNCKIILTNEKEVKRVEKEINKELEKIVNHAINVSQKELKSDILGFGERFYKEKYSYWKKNKKNWDNIFPTVEHSLKVNVELTNIGSTIKSAKEGGIK